MESIKILSFVNHLPEDGHCRSKHVGTSYIYKTVFVLSLCRCWNKVKSEFLSDACKEDELCSCEKCWHN
jgi:hypothetical protein